MSNQAEWMDNNDKYLAATLAWIKMRMERHLHRDENNSDTHHIKKSISYRVEIELACQFDIGSIKGVKRSSR